jgi:2-polyprenyl-3-methyl-5-hydroxy-6-metoxy-1,4-benzoquinol methylase
MEKNDRVARRFDRRASRYDNPWTAWLGGRELRGVRQLVPPQSQVLDYGCGSGRTALDLLSCSCQVTGYDISAGMLHLAQARAAQQGFTAEFTTRLDQLAGRTWPIITCIGVMDYYPDPVPLLVHLTRFLAPAGRLVVTFPNALSPLGWFYYLGSRFTVPATPRTPAKVRRFCQLAGLKIERMIFTLPAIPMLGYTMVLALLPAPPSPKPGSGLG